MHRPSPGRGYRVFTPEERYNTAVPYKDPERQREAARLGSARHYAKNQAQRMADKRERRHRSMRYLAERKAGPCTDCGGTFHPAAMDFDHMGHEVKVDNLSRLAWSGASLARLDTEIAKCELVCANCHRLRTWTRNTEHRSSSGQEAGLSSR